MSVKHRLAMYCKRHGLEKMWVFKLLVKLNKALFHRNEKQQFISGGEDNPDKIFYVIRGSGREVGLCSHFITVVNEAYDAMDRGYIPVVDFRDDRTQYNMPHMIHGTWNAWEYYFKQISGYTLEEVYKSKRIIVSGSCGFSERKKIAYGSDYSDASIKRVRDFACGGLIGVKEDVLEEVRRKREELFPEMGEVLGVFCRGTDYIALKPKGHPIQPNVQEVMAKTQEYLKRHPQIEKIFLATEDINIYNAFNAAWGGKCIVSDDAFVENYDGRDYICNYLAEDKYVTGRNYLVKMLLLAECDYLIASKASGSFFSMVMKEGDWKGKYIFELGVY